MVQKKAELHQILTAKIKKNPENPRIIFREEETQQLVDSIKSVGIKVPLSLYEEKNKYVLIDGERRWRCAKRLNLSKIPAIIHPKPSPLENLLTMFNIHNVRIDWDPMTIALKLKKVRDMFQKRERRPASAKDLSGITGVPLASVRRALDLLDLPQKYQTMLLTEGEKPRSEQKIKADLFIEIYKSLHAVERHVPEVIKEVPKSRYVESMVNKYRHKVINNVVSFRQISKIARSEKAGGKKDVAVKTLIKLVKDDKYSIDNAYKDTVKLEYETRDLIKKIEGVTEKLTQIKSGKPADNIKDALQRLRKEIERILGR